MNRPDPATERARRKPRPRRLPGNHERTYDHE